MTVIPARAGSKGIENKNLHPLLGRPLIAYAIVASRRAKRVSETYVSTDSEEIAEVAESLGAISIMRPAELATDDSSSEAALLHALDLIGEPIGALAFVQCTAPLVSAEDIDGALELLDARDADCVIAAAPDHRFLWAPSDDESLRPVNHDQTGRLRRQEFSQFVEAGSVYALRVESFRKVRHRFCGKTVQYEIPRSRHLEVDENVDLRIAEALLRYAGRAAALERLPSPTDALVLDFDGVLTDNTVYLDDSGNETVRLSRSDGLGIASLRDTGVSIFVISGEHNPIVATRCDKLDIPYEHGVSDKLATLTNWAKENAIDLDHIVYVGNDTNDVSCLKAVGCGVAVADAHPEVLIEADFILTSSGGHGAVREICDSIAATNRSCS